MIGRASRKATIQLSRRINNTDLSFGGVAVASIEQKYFANFYDQLDVGQGGRAMLIGLDGVVRAQRSDGGGVDSPETLKRLMGSIRSGDTGSRIVDSPLDGQRRIFSYRALVEFPITTAR